MESLCIIIDGNHQTEHDSERLAIGQSKSKDDKTPNRLPYSQTKIGKRPVLYQPMTYFLIS